MKTQPVDIWGEYSRGVEFLNTRDLFNIVQTNEKFFEGKQWEGMEKSNMPKPVFNVLQRAGKYMVATVGSNDIAISMTPFTEEAEEIDRMVPIAKEVENVIEVAKMKEQSKLIIRNAYVDGAGYMLLQFNPDVETGQPVQGIVESQIVDNTNVIFGNPYSNEIQKQPYIIIVLRQNINQVKEEAKELKVKEELIAEIQPDNNYNAVNDDSKNLVTVLLKFYKQRNKDGSKTVWFTKTTQNVALIPPTNLGYKRYPLSCFGWDPVKNSYLYTSPMTSVIQNQVFINKTYAIAQMYGLQSAFPKIVYDKTKLDLEDFMNTDASAVAGIDMMGKFLDFIKIPDFSNNIIQLAQETIAQTKECLGVTDASLGNVNPENTSAIIALQESSNVPLEIQKNSFFEFWEDNVRNLIDIMACTYGVRTVMSEEQGLAIVDFSVLKDLNYNLKVEIGNGAQFSEIAQVNTLDKLVQAGFITPDAYMQAVPSKYIPQKQMLLNSYYKVTSQGVPQSVGSTTASEVKPI